MGCIVSRILDGDLGMPQGKCRQEVFMDIFRTPGWEAFACFNHVLLHNTGSGILEKLTVPQLIKKLPEFYRTRMFIIATTGIRQWSLSEAS
jgi:hypothetical protein